MFSEDYKSWRDEIDDMQAWNAGERVGLRNANKALAATLTRLRATVVGRSELTEPQRAYLNALDDIAKAHDITTETIVNERCGCVVGMGNHHPAYHHRYPAPSRPLTQPE